MLTPLIGEHEPRHVEEKADSMTGSPTLNSMSAYSRLVLFTLNTTNDSSQATSRLPGIIPLVLYQVWSGRVGENVNEGDR